MEMENEQLDKVFKTLDQDKYLEVQFIEEIDIDKALSDDYDNNIESIFKEIRSVIYNWCRFKKGFGHFAPRHYEKQGCSFF